MPVKGKKAKEKKPEEKKTEKKAKEPEFAYGVKDIAEAMDTTAVAVRGMLRRRSIEKAGKSYGWNTQKDLDAVIKEISKKPAKDKEE